jgi:hypothetical protein
MGTVGDPGTLLDTLHGQHKPRWQAVRTQSSGVVIVDEEEEESSRSM